MFSKGFVAFVGFASIVPQAWAGFSASATNNIAVYWGQNSAGQANTQQRLSVYCANTNINIIPLAFLNVIVNPTTVNFANAGNNCTAFSGTTLLSCPQLEADIKTCQSTYGKTILLSVGGATYTEGGFSSSTLASTWADKIWAMFGPVQSGSSVNRPFNTAVVDGFDFDFEASTQNMAPFASRLRTNMDAATAAGSKKFYLSAAPQCVYPDAADNDMLNGAVAFDFISIQFYNNWCGVQNFQSGATTQNAFNFDVWDNWAKTVSKNKAVKLLLGIPASASAAGSGYVSGTQLSSVIAYCKTFSSFGGVMMWDMSQLYTNTGFLASVVSDLGGSVAATNPTTTAKMTTIRTTSRTTVTSTVKATTTVKATSKTTAKTTSSKTTPLPIIVKPTVKSSTTVKTSAKTSTTPVAVRPTRSVATSVKSTAKTTAKSVTMTTVKKTSTTAAALATGSPVAQWGQCGGNGYTGSTRCAAPYTCRFWSVWWSQCQ